MEPKQSSMRLRMAVDNLLFAEGSGVDDPEARAEFDAAIAELDRRLQDVPYPMPYGAGGNRSEQYPTTEAPLHDFIDMEAYDVVSGERHREAIALLRRVQLELAPNHAEAEDIRRKFGLAGSPELLDDIEAFLGVASNQRVVTELKGDDHVSEIARAALADSVEEK